MSNLQEVLDINRDVVFRFIFAVDPDTAKNRIQAFTNSILADYPNLPKNNPETLHAVWELEMAYRAIVADAEGQESK
jgi:hypothetical protein